MADAPAEDRVNIKDSYGEYYNIPRAQLQSVLDQGYEAVSDEEENEFHLQEEYGDTGGQIIAGGLGAARGATFGASDWLGKAAGFEEEIAGYKEANPTASTIGEIGGAVAPLVLSGGTSAVAKGAQTAGGLVLGAAKTGQTAGKLATAAAKGMGLAETGLAARALGAGAAGATEGFLFGSGQLISEAALGDPEEVAEKAVGHLGASMLIGFGAGAAMPALGAALSGAGRGAKKAISAALPEGDTLLQKLRRRMSVDALGGTSSTVRKLKDRYAEVADDLMTPQAALGGKKVISKTGSHADNLTNIETVLKATGEKIDEAVTALDSTGSKVSGSNIASKIEKNVLSKFEKSVGPKFKTIRKEVQGYIDDFNAAGDDTFESWNQHKKDAYAILDKEYGKAEHTVINDARIDIARIIKEEVNDSAKGLAEYLDKPELIDDLLEANRLYGSMSEAKPIAQQGVNRGQGNNILGISDLGLGSAVGVASGGFIPGAAMAVGSKLVRNRGQAVAAHTIDAIQDRVLPRLQKAVAAADDETATMVRRLVGGAAKQAKGAATATAKGAAKGAATAAKEQAAADLAPEFRRAAPRVGTILSLNNIKERMERIKEAKNDPVKYSERVLSSVGGDIHMQAPQVTAAISTTAMRAAEFMDSKIPRPAITEGVALPADNDFDMTTRERAVVSSQFRAIEHPSTVLPDLMSGNLTVEAAEAFRTVYPKMHQSIVMKLLEYPKELRAMPIAKRVDLSILLGVPLDSSTLPEFVQLSQSTYSAEEDGPQEQAPTSVNPTVSGLSKLNVAGRSQTKSERLQTR